jgi:hypothetical protein
VGRGSGIVEREGQKEKEREERDGERGEGEERERERRRRERVCERAGAVVVVGCQGCGFLGFRSFAISFCHVVSGMWPLGPTLLSRSFIILFYHVVGFFLLILERVVETSVIWCRETDGWMGAGRASVEGDTHAYTHARTNTRMHTAACPLARSRRHRQVRGEGTRRGERRGNAERGEGR